MKDENKLDAKLNVVKFPLNTTKFYTLGIEQDWVRELLCELNENADDKSPEANIEETSIELSLELTKKHKDICGDYILVKGQFSTQYVTRCVRTLEIMPDSLDIEFKACFLDESYQDDEAYADQDEIYQDDDMYELYYTTKKFADLAEMVHEQVYLSVNQYPIKDQEAPLEGANEASESK